MHENRQYTHDETLSLIEAAQQGEEEALEKVVAANIALVRSIVRKYLNRGTEYDDLYQIGSMGLVKAVKNFDASYEVRFSTYAVPMIAGEIKRYLRDDGIIKVSRSLKELAARVATAQNELSVRLGRDPGIAEIAVELGEEPETVAMAMEASRPYISLYEPVHGDQDDALVLDRMCCEGDAAEDAVNRVLLKELLNTLSRRDRSVIMMRYFGDKTQSQIAKVLGISQVQVSRIENRIMRQLREVAK